MRIQSAKLKFTENQKKKVLKFFYSRRKVEAFGINIGIARRLKSHSLHLFPGS